MGYGVTNLLTKSPLPSKLGLPEILKVVLDFGFTVQVVEIHGTKRSVSRAVNARVSAMIFNTTPFSKTARVCRCRGASDWASDILED